MMGGENTAEKIFYANMILEFIFQTKEAGAELCQAQFKLCWLSS